jgi:Flp pilus assembly protein TadG
MTMFVALLLPVLVGMAGLALDMGNLYMSQSRLQAATDSAALAGSLDLPYDPELSKGLVSAAAREMLQKNYPNATATAITAGTDVRSVCVQSRATVGALLLQTLGVNATTVTARACAGFNNLDIVLVIDNTGSMSGTPMTMVRQSSLELVDLIMPDGGTPTAKIGLVPFRGKVHVGANVDGKPDGCRNADGTQNTGLLSKYSDPYHRVSADTCSSIPRIAPLTGDKATIKAAINSQTATGASSGTVISEGIKWGRQVLSPAAPYTQGGDPKKYRKIMILLTDGDTEDGTCGGSYRATYTPNDYWTNAYYGMGTTTCHCEDGGCLNQAMLTEAQNAKNEGVEIFTIRYGDSDTTDRNLMKTVASSRAGTTDHYFDAPSTSAIGDVFKQIGRQLGWRLLN